MKKPCDSQGITGFLNVGLAGFEPTTSTTPTQESAIESLDKLNEKLLVEVDVTSGADTGYFVFCWDTETGWSMVIDHLNPRDSAAELAAFGKTVVFLPKVGVIPDGWRPPISLNQEQDGLKGDRPTD